MKVLVICSSDVLGIPAIINLQQRGLLLGVAIPERAKKIMIPTLVQCGIPIDHIHHLTKADLLHELKWLIEHYRPEALFTLTCPWMIPAEILALLPNRCINFHFGLLPQYKGSDPVFWQIFNQETKGGISIHLMTTEIDDGPMLLREEIPLIPGETYGLHCERLGTLSAQTVFKVLEMLASGTTGTKSITEENALYLKKPAPSQLTIQWQKQPSNQIEALINACNPRYGGALTSIRQMQLKILEASPADLNNPNPTVPGAIVYADATYGLIVACLNNQHLKINVVHLREGYLSGVKLFGLGFKVGECFV